MWVLTFDIPDPHVVAVAAPARPTVTVLALSPPKPVEAKP